MIAPTSAAVYEVRSAVKMEGPNVSQKVSSSYHAGMCVIIHKWRPEADNTGAKVQGESGALAESARVSNCI